MPAVTSWGSDRIDIFGLGTNNAMFHKSWDGNSWQPSQTGWDSQGGTFSSAPAVTSWGLNRIDIFDLGSAINDMQHRAWTGSAWSPTGTGWETLGGIFDAD